jgi:hypothetical protein
MNGSLPELLEEELKLRRLRRLVDQTTADLRWRTGSHAEAQDRIELTRRQVLELFPDGEELFDLIYRPKFGRIANEHRGMYEAP